ncbi:hypothetical protein ABPG74_010762 [Tetrahymena malaccensis]
MHLRQKSVPVTSKTLFYQTDGTGRDSYIKVINGGLLPQDRLHELKPKPVSSVERMEFQKKKYHRTLPPKSENKVVNYYSDGSGRDHYICINSGGRMDTSYHWRNQVDFKFNSSLRQYEKIPHSFQRDLWRDSMQGFRNQKNPRQLSSEKTVATEQMNLTMRLSQPKPSKRGRCQSFQEKSQSFKERSQTRDKIESLNSNKITESQNGNTMDILRNDKDFIRKKLSSTANNFNAINKSLNKTFNASTHRQMDNNNLSFYK